MCRGAMKDFLAQDYYYTEHYGHVVKIMYTMLVYYNIVIELVYSMVYFCFPPSPPWALAAVCSLEPCVELL